MKHLQMENRSWETKSIFHIFLNLLLFRKILHQGQNLALLLVFYGIGVVLPWVVWLLACDSFLTSQFYFQDYSTWIDFLNCTCKFDFGALKFHSLILNRKYDYSHRWWNLNYLVHHQICVILIQLARIISLYFQLKSQEHHCLFGQ